MTLKSICKSLTGLLLLSLLLTSGLVTTAQALMTQDASRAKLLSYVLRQQLTQQHFSHKPLDDALSKSAYDLFLKQLDFQKRFLLQEDIDQLATYSTRIDDELNQGQIELPVVAGKLLQTRIKQVKQIVADILNQPFDLNRDESLQTDADKLAWCKTLPELKERWRKILKYQVINSMLILEDPKDQESADQKPDAAQAEKLSPAAQQEKSREKVAKRFEHFFDRLLKDTPRDYYDRYFNAITRAYDPHTTYFPPQEKEDFEIGMRGSLEGIGATLREDDGFIKVVRIIPGSAAARQGDLEAEDVILAVAQGKDEPVDVTDTRLRDAVELIRGPKGTEVRLTVKKPDGAHKVIAITRDVVEIEETFAKWTILPSADGKKVYGYIKIPSFYRDFQSTFMGGSGRNVTDDVAKAVRALDKKHIAGLIIDLRNNGGGALTDAVRVSGLFIDHGPVVQVKSSNGKIQVLKDQDRGTLYDGPMVVMVNRFSASASEIFAAAMQDYHRAIILGSKHTYGKGTVQTILDLDRSIPFRDMDKYKPLGALKITTQKFYRVSGGSTQAKGVESDVVVPDRLEYIKSGEKYIDNALPWDHVAKSDYTPWVKSEPLKELRSLSKSRLSHNKEFQAITKEAEEAKQKSEQTLVSLRIDQIRSERTKLKKLETAAGDAFHGAGDDLADDNTVDSKDWSERLRKDPYAIEAEAVLHDLGSAPATVKATATTEGETRQAN